MYLKLRGTGFGNPLYKHHLPQRGEIQFPAKATPHLRMMFTDTGARAGCHTLPGAEVWANRSRGRESA